MLVSLVIAALLGGVGLVALAGRARTAAGAEARAATFERAGGALLAGGLVGLGFLLAHADV